MVEQEIVSPREFSPQDSRLFRYNISFVDSLLSGIRRNITPRDNILPSLGVIFRRIIRAEGL